MSATAAVFAAFAALSAICACSAQTSPELAIAQVGYIDNDVDPGVNACSNWDFEGGVAWDYACRSFVAGLQRPALVTGVSLIVERKVPTAPTISPEDVSVYTSMDNRRYTKCEGGVAVRFSTPDLPGEFRRADVTGLRVLARYVKLAHKDAGGGYGFATNKLNEVMKVYGDSAGVPTIDGLSVEPAQEAGHLRAFCRVSAAAAQNDRLHLRIENTQSLEASGFDAPFEAGRWTAIEHDAPQLVPGGYWLTAELSQDGTVVAQASAAFRVHTAVLDLEGDAGAATPGGAMVTRAVPEWLSGEAEPFAYRLPHDSGRAYKGAKVAKGQQVTVKTPACEECAVYASVDNPWPELQVSWGPYKATVPATQEDWSPTGGTQELFLGVGQSGSAGPSIEAVGGDLRIYHLRVACLSDEEAALAHHVTDPAGNRRVIYNNDGFTEFFGQDGWDKARLLQLVERYEGTDTEFMELAAFVSGAVNFPSACATFWRRGEVPSDQWLRKNEEMAINLWNDLEDLGLPIYPTLVARGREIGVPVWGSLRMSAYYGIREEKRMQPFNGKLWHEHPEMRIRERSGGYGTQMSFAWPQVREQRIGVLAEMAQTGCEGVMMDFCRYPEVLGYDEPLVESFRAQYGVDPTTLPADDPRWVKHRCELMNGFFRDVRARIDEVGRAQGRKIRISVRAPATGCQTYGFDPDTWAKERLMDIFIPHYPGLEKDFDIRPWVELARPYGILVYPGMEPTKSQTSTTELTDAQVRAGVKPGTCTNMTRDDYRRKAWLRYRRGADGVFLFNLWTIGETRNLLGDKESLRKWSYFEDPMNLARSAAAPG